MKDILLNRIWREMKQFRTDFYYAEDKIDVQIRNVKFYNIFVAVFSTGGVGLSMVSLYISFCTTIIVSIVSIMNQFYPVFFLKSEDLIKLYNLKSDFGNYFNQLQNLYYLSACTDKLTEEDIILKLDELRKEYIDKQTEIGKLFGKINKKKQIEAQDKCDNELKETFNIKN